MTPLFAQRRSEAELSRAIYLRTDNQRAHVTCYAPAWHTDRCHRQRRVIRRQRRRRYIVCGNE